MPRTAAAHTDPRPLVERQVHEPGEDKHRRVRRTVTVNLAESPLSWLHARGHLSERQYMAGEKLRADYEAAAIGPHVTMKWDGMPRRKGNQGERAVYASGRVAAAKARFDAALAALGPDLTDIAWRVICAGESVPVAERTLSWPTRSGKLVLRIALDRLAEYYRLPG